jgi:hypothetical protein
MNPKTDNRPAATQEEPEFSPTFLTWLVTLTIATLFFVFVADVFHHPKMVLMRGFSPFPWVNAAGMTIEDGLAEFSGGTPSPATPQQRTTVLASLLAVLVIGPTLFLFGWRQRRLVQDSAGPRSNLTIPTILFILGGTLSFTVVVPAVPAAIFQRMVSNSMRKSQAVSSNKDEIINELNWVKTKAYEYRILPGSMGGGGGSYEGFQLPAAMASSGFASYELRINAPDTIRIKASSKLFPGSQASAAVGPQGMFLRGEWGYEGQFK